MKRLNKCDNYIGHNEEQSTSIKLPIELPFLNMRKQAIKKRVWETLSMNWI